MTIGIRWERESKQLLDVCGGTSSLLAPFSSTVVVDDVCTKYKASIKVKGSFQDFNGSNQCLRYRALNWREITKLFEPTWACILCRYSEFDRCILSSEGNRNVPRSIVIRAATVVCKKSANWTANGKALCQQSSLPATSLTYESTVASRPWTLRTKRARC